MSIKDCNASSPDLSAEEKGRESPTAYHHSGDDGLLEDPDAGASEEERKAIV